MKVIKCVADSLAIELDGIHTHSLLINDLGADSLDFMDIMFHIEDEFKIAMQKEDLDFLARIDLDRESAIVEGHLTLAAKQKLQKWLPSMPMDTTLSPPELADYLSIESLTIVIETALTH